MEHLCPSDQTETQYISQSLKRIRQFGRRHGVHVWIVVHPTKLRKNERGEYPVPTLYDCGGSAHWRNKADNGICIWRDLGGDAGPMVDVHIQKIRFRQIGRLGMSTLKYQPAWSGYEDPANPRAIAI
jgi:twinkle protein